MTPSPYRGIYKIKTWCCIYNLMWITMFGLWWVMCKCGLVISDVVSVTMGNTRFPFWYLEFGSSFDDRSDRNSNPTKVTSSVMENECSYRGFNFLKNVISRYCKQSAGSSTWSLGCRENTFASTWAVSVSLPCPEYSNNSVSMESLNEQKEPTNIFQQLMTKKLLPLGLRLEILYL